MATFVLVPGFWLGAWAWERVAEELRAAGHRVHAVTLTGLAERAGEAAPGVNVDTHADDVVRVVEDGDLREVVLVAHSGATLPVTTAAARIAGRLARLVYVDTAPLPEGMAQIDFYEPEERAAVDKRIAEQGGGAFVPPPAFDTDEGEYAGLAEETRAELRRRATPEPVGAATQPQPAVDRLPGVPKTLVSCTIPLAFVEQMIEAGNPVFVSLAGPEWTFTSLPTGHWPMFSEPVALAKVLAAQAP